MILIDRAKLQHASDMARLSGHAYSHDDTVLPQGWKQIDDSSKTIDAHTGFYAALYEKTDAKEGEQKYAIAFRGTKVFYDIASDVDIALRQVPGQFALAMGFVEDSCKKHKINLEDMELTGHSLGGYLARTVGTALPVKKVWTFNSPGPTEATRDYLAKLLPENALPNDKLIQFRSKFDLISHWGYDEGEIIEVKTKGDHHSLQNLSQQIARLENPSLPNVAVGGKVFSLSGVFNRVSKLAMQSKMLAQCIHKLFTYDVKKLTGQKPLGQKPSGPKPAAKGGMAYA